MNQAEKEAKRKATDEYLKPLMLRAAQKAAMATWRLGASDGLLAAGLASLLLSWYMRWKAKQKCA